MCVKWYRSNWLTHCSYERPLSSLWLIRLFEFSYRNLGTKPPHCRTLIVIESFSQLEKNKFKTKFEAPLLTEKPT